MDETLRYISEPPQVPLLEAPKWWHRFSKKGWAFIIGLIPLFFITSFAIYFLSAPQTFPKDYVYTIKNGATLSGIAAQLESEHVIKSDFVFKVLVKLFAPRSGALAGDYEFDVPQNSLIVAWRIAYGRYDLTLERITIPEGLTSFEIGELFAKNKKFSAFDLVDFKKLALTYEGYLFPDTYLFLPNVTAAQVVDVMVNTYKKKIENIKGDLARFGRPIGDVIRMASILEEEGRTKDTRETIAGILWKRLDMGMPLQVDASIVYLSGKKSGNYLSADDFKIQSPYNTYLHKGLPPTPISNPGLDTINATINPKVTKYYFYLTDPQGGFWPAVTYDEHLVNKAKYLK